MAREWRISAPVAWLSLLISLSAMAGTADTLRFEAAPIFPNDGNTVHYAYVYLPDNYNTDTCTYPVVYLFHGFMGNQYSWEEKGDLSHTMDSLIEEGAIPPMIVVMPYCIPKDTTQAVQVRTFTYNMFHYGRLKRGEFEQTFRNIEEYIRANFRTADDSLCAIAGLSYGARVAANISKERQYKSVGLFSPVISKEQYPEPCQFEGENCTHYWIGCGRGDFFRPDTRKLVRYMERKRMPHSYHSTAGRHNWKTWRAYLAEFLKENYGQEASALRQDDIELTVDEELMGE